MRKGRLLISLLAALSVLALIPAGAAARDTIVTSFDGTPIVTHFFPAEGASRMRGARPGRPLRVRVRPVRIRMRATRVVLRDARGRVVGRSRRVRIGTRGRAVRVPVRRAIRAGARYRFGASGRAVDGRRLSDTRRLRVRRPGARAAAAALAVFG